MAEYLQAAAACDLGVLDTAPQGIVDATSIIDAAARREIRQRHRHISDDRHLSPQPTHADKGCQTTAVLWKAPPPALASAPTPPGHHAQQGRTGNGSHTPPDCCERSQAGQAAPPRCAAAKPCGEQPDATTHTRECAATPPSENGGHAGSRADGHTSGAPATAPSTAAAERQQQQQQQQGDSTADIAALLRRVREERVDLCEASESAGREGVLSLESQALHELTVLWVRLAMAQSLLGSPLSTVSASSPKKGGVAWSGRETYEVLGDTANGTFTLTAEMRNSVSSFLNEGRVDDPASPFAVLPMVGSRGQWSVPASPSKKREDDAPPVSALKDGTGTTTRSPSTASFAPLAVPKRSNRANSQVVRVGTRRFTVLKKAPPGNADKVSGWKTMQARLNEVKMQTLLQSYAQSEETGEPVHRIVLTGGPCAGKSTGMVCLKGQLEHHGFNVFCVPEAATLLIQGGGDKCFEATDKDTQFVFQLSLLETQLALEDAFYAVAKACGKKAVLLCDRGAMDGRAFCDDALWERILQAGEWSTPELRDSRYDLVIHLVTAANGAKEFYGTENNSTRTETPEEAIAQDYKLQGCWTGFPKLRIIDNSTSFMEKMNRCLRPILDFVGINTRPGVQKRYKVMNPPSYSDIQSQIRANESRCTIHVLRGSNTGNTIRVLHREDGKSNTYTYQSNRKQNGEVFKVERPLSQNVYQSLLGQVDPKVHVVRKRILSFIHEHQYFEMGHYEEPEALVGIATLDVETARDGKTDVERQLHFPPFIDPKKLDDISHLIQVG